MDSTTIIRVVAGVMFLAVFFVGIAIGIFYILAVSRVLNKCSPSSRTMQPGMVWLLLIPFFNIIWNFVVVLAVAKSVGKEFQLRNIPSADPEPGKPIGLAMCICGACGIIPFVGLLAGLAYLVLWIIYWVKVNEFSRALDQELPVLNAVSSGL